MLPAVAACLYVLFDIRKLERAVAKQSLTGATHTVKLSAKKVPIWLTVVAWSMLGAAFALFIGGNRSVRPGDDARRPAHLSASNPQPRAL
jgi:hypothetical protein